MDVLFLGNVLLYLGERVLFLGNVLLYLGDKGVALKRFLCVCTPHVHKQRRMVSVVD